MNDQVDHSRRRLLTAATVGTGAIGVAFAAVPFLASWQPSARAKALGAPVAVDASKLDAGTDAEGGVARAARVRRAPGQDRSSISWATMTRCWPDPKSDDSLQPDYIKATGAARARNPEYWVGLAVCTHLGCSPLGAFEANNSFQVAGVDLGHELAGRLLLPVSRLEVRYIGPGLQEHAGAQEPDRAALRLR